MRTRTPIILYGGKTSLLNKILPLIPEKIERYVEPYFGGGSVYFSLPNKPKSEIINDKSDFLINFYAVLKNDFDDLKKKVDATLYSRATFKVALAISHSQHLFTQIQRAWAYWVLVSQSFSGSMSGWSFDKKSAKAKTFHNKKLRFTKELSQRMEQTTIENIQAIKVIKRFDDEDSFMFIDPPYLSGADQGCYKGFDENEYIELLDTLSNVKGKFLLTTYDSDLLTEYVKRNGWHQIKIEKPLTASKSKGGKRKRKIEVISMNYLMFDSL